MGRKKRTSGASGSRFRLESQPLAGRRELLESFSRELEKALDSSRGASEPLRDVGRKGIMDAVGKATGFKLDVRQFDSFLQHLYDGGQLRIRPYLVAERAEALRKKKNLGGLQGITVVAGRDRDRFAQAAAEDFIRRMFEIGNAKRTGPRAEEAWLNVGIVSGNTTGLVVGAAKDLKWARDLDMIASDLPPVRVFALNVCLTGPGHLDGNATILAQQLAKKIDDEANEDGKAQAYGLSAPLIVEERRLRDVDRAPQTREVLEFTEPCRVAGATPERGGSGSATGATHTELDIVLTGVGELPRRVRKEARDEPSPGGEKARDRGKASGAKSESQGSIFYKLAKQVGEQFDFDMDEMIETERIVGDIAFTAIRADGEPVPLRRRCRNEADKSNMAAESSQSDEDTQYVIYSAVTLPVLAAMARDSSKSVILVARYEEGKYKVPAVFASIAGERHRYASRLIIDEETAQRLLHY
jgi:hypothetical protein